MEKECFEPSQDNEHASKLLKDTAVAPDKASFDRARGGTDQHTVGPIDPDRPSEEQPEPDEHASNVAPSGEDPTGRIGDGAEPAVLSSQWIDAIVDGVFGASETGTAEPARCGNQQLENARAEDKPNAGGTASDTGDETAVDLLIGQPAVRGSEDHTGRVETQTLGAVTSLDQSEVSRQSDDRPSDIQ